MWDQYVWITNNSAGWRCLRPRPRICLALMAKGWPAWRLCSCGRSFLCGSLASAKATLSKCRVNHFDLADLKLAAGEVTLAATVFIILSHAGQKHHERALQQQLRKLGARRVITVYGNVYGKTKHMGRIVKSNQITMFSIRHRWLRAAWKAIQDNARSPTRAVVYLECNAFFEEPTVNLLLDALVASPHSADIRWMGWRRVHRASMWKFKHPNEVIEGSKAIGFVRGGLRRMAAALCNPEGCPCVLRLRRGALQADRAKTHHPEQAVIVRDAETQVCPWLARGTHNLSRCGAPSRLVMALAFSFSGNRFATGRCEHKTKLWVMATGQQLQNLEWYTYTFLSVPFSLEGKSLATGRSDRTVRLWCVATGYQMQILKGDSKSVTSVACSLDGETLATGNAYNTARLWDTSTR